MQYCWVAEIQFSLWILNETLLCHLLSLTLKTLHHLNYIGRVHWIVNLKLHSIEILNRWCTVSIKVILISESTSRIIHYTLKYNMASPLRSTSDQNISPMSNAVADGEHLVSISLYISLFYYLTKPWYSIDVYVNLIMKLFRGECIVIRNERKLK